MTKDSVFKPVDILEDSSDSFDCETFDNDKSPRAPPLRGAPMIGQVFDLPQP